MRKNKSSKNWIIEQHRDQYFKQAKSSGFRSRSAYKLLELNKKYDIDGNVRRNKARYINHSCNPNCEVDIKNDQIWISSIKTGE